MITPLTALSLPLQNHLLGLLRNMNVCLHLAWQSILLYTRGQLGCTLQSYLWSNSDIFSKSLINKWKDLATEWFSDRSRYPNCGPCNWYMICVCTNIICTQSFLVISIYREYISLLGDYITVGKTQVKQQTDRFSRFFSIDKS